MVVATALVKLAASTSTSVANSLAKAKKIFESLYAFCLIDTKGVQLSYKSHSAKRLLLDNLCTGAKKKKSRGHMTEPA